MDPLVLDPAIDLRPHHAESIANMRPTVLAVLLGGSIAHGFAAPSADIDIVVVVTPAEYRRRERLGVLTHATAAPCTYEGGCVDAKFVDRAFLERVAESGSEPARFAFADARLAPDRAPYVRELLPRIVESLQKLTLFSCRLVLAHNRMLYPYHKWMLQVTESAPDRPAELMDDLDRLLREPNAELIDDLVRSMLDLAGLDHDQLNARWGGHFLRDNELTWMTGSSPVDDL